MIFKDVKCRGVLNVPEKDSRRGFRKDYCLSLWAPGPGTYKFCVSAHSRSELRKYSDPVPALANYAIYEKNSCKCGGLWPIIGPPKEEYYKVLREKTQLEDDKIIMKRLIGKLKSKIRKLLPEQENSFQNKQQLQEFLPEFDETELDIIKEGENHNILVENLKREKEEFSQKIGSLRKENERLKKENFSPSPYYQGGGSKGEKFLSLKNKIKEALIGSINQGEVKSPAISPSGNLIEEETMKELVSRNMPDPFNRRLTGKTIIINRFAKEMQEIFKEEERREEKLKKLSKPIPRRSKSQ